MSKKVLVRLGAEFLLTQEEDNKLESKWVSVRDKEGNVLVEGELYLVGYEDEDGNECDEDGEPL